MSCLQNRSPQLLKYARLFNYGGFARLSSAATSSTEVMRREKLVSANNYEPLPVVITRGEGEIKTTNDFLGGGLAMFSNDDQKRVFSMKNLKKGRPDGVVSFERTCALPFSNLSFELVFVHAVQRCAEIPSTGLDGIRKRIVKKPIVVL